MPMPRNPDRIRGMAAELKIREAREQAEARKPLYGFCPVCRKERKLTGTLRKLKSHRRFVRKVMPDYLPGEMVPCDGSGIYPLR